MTNIIKFPEEPSPDECLENQKGRLAEVVILGVTEDGSVVVSGNLGIAESIMLVAMGYKILLDGAFGEDDVIH